MTPRVTDKIGHGYERAYRTIAAVFDTLLDRPVRILEVGVAEGAGTRWFGKLFPGAQIAGVDCHYRAAAVDAFAEVGSPPEWYLITTQESSDLAAAVTAATGIDRWDLVVDDASHEDTRTSATLRSLWPLVAPGGCYVVEDWSHADMILGAFAERLTREFDEREAARPYDLGDVGSMVYAPGMITIYKRVGSDA